MSREDDRVIFWMAVAMAIVSAAGGRETLSQPPTRRENGRNPLPLGAVGRHLGGGCATIRFKG
jgi:hypothetical protein